MEGDGKRKGTDKIRKRKEKKNKNRARKNGYLEEDSKKRER